MRHLGGVLTAAQSWRALAQHAGHWVLRGYGPWAIERHAWGHGYATVAARAALEWTWASLEADRLISVIAPGNAASIRVAERLGIEPLRDETLDGNPVRIYGIDRPRLRTGIRG